MPPEIQAETRLSFEDAQTVANAMMLVQEIGLADQAIEAHGEVQTAGDGVLKCTGFAKSIISQMENLQAVGASNEKARELVGKSVMEHATTKTPEPVLDGQDKAPALNLETNFPLSKAKKK